MIAVIFEVWPADGQRDAYLDDAARLRPALEAMDGFISVERFQSLTDPGKMLSLSIWRDEAAVAGWRRHIGHRGVQRLGREGVFKDYRIRVASVLRDYALLERRDEAPADSKQALGA
ncbi:MAG: antibiotic biosynthesis monooxygenase [Hyphomicrobiaceae bacterium]|nr:antibiotic biosynthesis monooxygenase [Hyphomicrobiaceae bacterium]